MQKLFINGYEIPEATLESGSAGQTWWAPIRGLHQALHLPEPPDNARMPVTLYLISKGWSIRSIRDRLATSNRYYIQAETSELPPC